MGRLIIVNVNWDDKFSQYFISTDYTVIGTTSLLSTRSLITSILKIMDIQKNQSGQDIYWELNYQSNVINEFAKKVAIDAWNKLYDLHEFHGIWNGMIYCE